MWLSMITLVADVLTINVTLFITIFYAFTLHFLLCTVTVLYAQVTSSTVSLIVSFCLISSNVGFSLVGSYYRDYPEIVECIRVYKNR